MTLTAQQLERGLQDALFETGFGQLGPCERGKVRDSYRWGGYRAQVATDRVSAFDVVLGTIPFKGQVLNGISAYWFEQTAELCPNHLVEVVDPSVSIVRQAQPFGLEVVVRGYLTGSSSTSIWTRYAAGERSYCGHRLPEGMRKHQALAQALVTPTTKAPLGSHDEPVSAQEAVRRGILTDSEFDEVSHYALALFARGQQLAAERGLLLVDTKYEFGRDSEGRVIVIDEIHTPDSSRYWYRDGYEVALCAGTDPQALDKEHLRRHLLQMGFSGEGKPPRLDDAVRAELAQRYAETYALLTGQSFCPDIAPPRERVLRALQAAYQRYGSSTGGLPE